ncbi:MAG: AraC family transcriptional regulator [Vicinamibacterales bacterium]
MRQYIDEHLADTVTLRDLSTVAGLSDCHFSRAFKLTVGIPPLRFVMTRRIIEATALLLQTDRRISDISQDVGFADQSHFTRCFVAIMRQTPRSLRRNSR